MSSPRTRSSAVRPCSIRRRSDRDSPRSRPRRSRAHPIPSGALGSRAGAPALAAEDEGRVDPQFVVRVASPAKRASYTREDRRGEEASRPRLQYDDGPSRHRRAARLDGPLAELSVSGRSARQSEIVRSVIGPSLHPMHRRLSAPHDIARLHGVARLSRLVSVSRRVRAPHVRQERL